MRQSHQWRSEDVLITVKTYPNLSKGHREVSCVAGITGGGEWIRLHPVPFRFLAQEARFKKYNIIRANVSKSSDFRPESHNLDLDSIEIISTVPTTGQWSRRHEWILPRVSATLEELQAKEASEQTLGLIRVAQLEGLIIEPQEGGWTERELAKLSQGGLFDRDVKPLERPPFRFSYRFRCDGEGCKGHKLQLLDWEVIQSYRSWWRQYGPRGWEEKFRQKYEGEMSQKDLHLFVGTLKTHSRNWTGVGLYYPPRRSDA